MGFFSNIGFGSVLPIIGNGIDALVGHYESNRQMHFQQDTMREQMAWQEKMNAQQQEWQEGMWNKTNEYNTPQAQLDRMMAAGINPNNVAMQVAGGSNNANMAQQPQIPGAAGGLNGSSPAPTNFGQGLKEAALMDSAIELNKANAEAARDQGQAALKNAGVNEGNLELNRRQLDAVINQMDKQNQLIDQNIKVGIEEEKGKALQNAYQEFYNNTLLPLIEQQNIKQIEALQQNINESKARVSEISAQIKNINQQIEESKKRMELIQSEADKTNAEAELVKLQKVRQELENEAKSINNDISRQLGYDVEKLSASQIGVMGVYRLFDNISTSLKRSAQFMVGKGHTPNQIREAMESTPNRFTPYTGNSFVGTFNPY